MGYDDYGGGNPHKNATSDHREEGAEKHRRDVVDTGVRRGVEGIWNSENNHTHFPLAGYGSTVDGFKTNI